MYITIESVTGVVVVIGPSCRVWVRLRNCSLAREAPSVRTLRSDSERRALAAHVSLPLTNTTVGKTNVVVEQPPPWRPPRE